MLKNHPDVNRENVEWKQSSIGKKYAALKRDKLPWKQRLDEQGNLVEWTDAPIPPIAKPPSSGAPAKVTPLFNVINDGDKTNSTLTHDIFVRGKVARSKRELNVFLDSGAIDGNYINAQVISDLIDNEKLSFNFNTCNKLICSAFNSCVKINKNINLSITLTYLKVAITINIVAEVVDKLPFDLVIGLKSIRKFRLTDSLSSFFIERDACYSNNPDVATTLGQSSAIESRGMPISMPVEHQPRDNLDRLGTFNKNNVTTVIQHNQNELVHSFNMINAKETCTCKEINKCNNFNKIKNNCKDGFYPFYENKLYLRNNLNRFNIKDINDIIDCEYLYSLQEWFSYDTSTKEILIPKSQIIDIDHDDDDSNDYFEKHDWHLITLATEDVQMVQLENRVTIHGSATLRARIIDVIKRYENVFQTQVASEPARIPPMVLRVDKTKWAMAKNSLAARRHSQEKRIAIDNFLEKALKLGIVEPCQAPHWSQVHLVPKPPPAMWRFCIDYINLNETLEGMHWPIPDIKSLLQRLGEANAEYFAVFDLTSGYHQVAISHDSRDFSAFITHRGLFRWTRIPMGIKSAPSYFQYHMGQNVLSGLLYHICELYIDDIIVHASTEDQLIQRLEIIFKRLIEFKIFLNPDKGHIGLKEVEYVGHVIDKTGITFSKEKREAVLNFRLPRTHHEMRSFLGLATYFRDHIDHHAEKVLPLHNLIHTAKGYNPKAIIKWTDELKEYFFKVQKAVASCPKLYFHNKDAPVILNTDASGYGVGAYLYQIIDGKEYPVAFVSKTLSKQQRRWDSKEREAYAIFYALRQLEHIIRDVKFVLRTDHMNLTFLNTNLKDKVKRWKLVVQHFDFDLEHIPGKKNTIADLLSRLVPYTKEDESDSEKEPEPDDGPHFNSLHEVSERHIRRLDSDKYDLISKVHNSSMGHHGVERTITKLKKLLASKSKSEWTGLRTDVTNFVRTCPCCQKMSQLRIPIMTSPYTTATYNVMDRLNIDTIGPLPASSKGDKYIICIIDCFSRFVTLHPSENTTALAAAKALLQHVGTFGIPCQLLSDNGTQYANETIAELTKLMGVDQLFTQAYSHEENALVERANKEAMRHLRAIVYERKIKEEWYLFLPLVQRIMNSMNHISIGVSPAEVLFGNSVTLDRGIFSDGGIPPHNSSTLSEYTSKMLQAQATILKIAKLNQEETDAFHLGRVPKEKITEFPINSYVLVAYETEGNRPPTKLHSRWRGPLKVVGHVGQTYTCLNLVNNKLEDFNINFLRPFDYDVERIDPYDVALRDNQDFHIESVDAHKGDPNRVSTLTFRVKWVGYDEPTWEPWKNVYKVGALHEYLRNHNMKRLIPKNIK